MGAWWAWGMLLNGCVIVAQGAYRLAGRTSRYPVTRTGAVGQIAMGAGLAADGVPDIVGWSSAVGASVAAAGAAAVLLGVVLQVGANRLPRPHRASRGR